MPAATARPANSTNVRLYGAPLPLSFRAYRTGLKALAAVAPGLAQRHAADLFFTPRRRGTPRAPEIDGLTRTDFGLEVDGEHVYGWAWGEGPTVLLAHGWEGNGRQLRSFVQPLVARGFRAVTWDMPAHGLSTGRQTNGMIMAECMELVADRHGPVHGVIAHSLGAMAATFALSLGLPARRAVLIAPGTDPREFAFRMADALDLSESTARGMLRLIAERVGGDLSRFHVPTRALDIEVPALVLHDVDDAEAPFAGAEEIVSKWRGAELVPLRGLGHHKPLKDAQVIARAVEFVSR
jgi:pimeloyl-ACP methyl ester carboxylesterase